MASRRYRQFTKRVVFLASESQAKTLRDLARHQSVDGPRVTVGQVIRSAVAEYLSEYAAAVEEAKKAGNRKPRERIKFRSE